jgi:hypothetical protein
MHSLIDDPIFDGLSRLAKIRLESAGLTTYADVAAAVRSGRKLRNIGKKLSAEIRDWVGPPYIDPKSRAKKLVDEFVSQSVNRHFTLADNAIFALEAYGLISKAFTELIPRNHVLAEMIEG